MSDDDGIRWAAFIAALPSAWVPVAMAFSRASGVVEGKLEPDGAWTLDLMFGLPDLSHLLREAPVEFVSVASGESWWMDQHLEDEGGVAVAKAARAIISWTDNFASGLNATLCIFSSDEVYEAALAEARTRHEERYDDEEDAIRQERSDEGDQ